MEKLFVRKEALAEYIVSYPVQWGFPGGSVVKNLPSSAGDICLILGSARSSEEGHGSPLHYSCLENPMGGGAWEAVQSMEVAKIRTRLSDFTFPFI